MYEVAGRVLVRETGNGIGNLLVALYDVDPTAGPSAQPHAEFLPGFRGDRIGSILTNRDGDFKLQFESTVFVAGDPERKPDLVLAVFAPEDSRGPADPTPLPPQDRVLVFSNLPRRDAGLTEAYVLRVSRSQLDRFGIPHDGPAAPSGMSAQLAGSILDAWKARDRFRDEVRPRLQQEAAKLKATGDRASSKFVGLSRLSAARRASPLFVHRKTSPEVAQTFVVQEGLKAMRRRPRRMYRRITRDDARALGLEIIDGHLRGDLDVRSIWPAHVKGEGESLVRARTLIEACRDRKRAAGAGAMAPDVPAAPVAPEEPAPAPSPQDQLLERVLGQIRDLESTPQDAIGRRSDAEQIEADLGHFSLKGGGADAAAVHDFHTLQIAFKHVWQEAFDEELGAMAESFYATAFHVADQVGFGEPNIPAIEAGWQISHWRQFIDGVRTAGEQAAQALPPPEDVVLYFPQLADANVWSSLSPEQQQTMMSLAVRIAEEDDAQKRSKIHDDAVLYILQQPQGALGRLQMLYEGIAKRLHEPYSFDVFAPHSYNFGILTTYRQRWEPVSYQAGDLVATIPLAPGESRKFSQRVVVKTSRSERELAKSSATRREEFTQTSREDNEIVHKASTATNFKQTAEGAFTVGIVSLSGTTEFAQSQQEESSRVKKDFREAVIRAAQEYSNERSLEVTTSGSQDLETSSSGEISNPNTELTVTYLLYELQRRYKVSEHLHRLTPVILVAQEVPAPHEIDDDWMIVHEWILRRVLLDDRLAPALDYLTRGMPSDELNVEVSRAVWEKNREVLGKTQQQVENRVLIRDRLRAELANAIQNVPDNAGAVSDIVEFFTGGEDEEAKLESRREALGKALDFAQSDLAEAQQRLTAAATAFQESSDKLTRAITAQANHRTAADQLRVHIKQNVLYYMQAIWAHEPPDQRFFRLYDQTVFWVTAPAQVHIDADFFRGLFSPPGQEEAVEIELPAPDGPAENRTLVEVANLDTLLGFKGNCLIFPLKEPCYLTQFMMQEYVDDYLGIRDPDPFGSYTTEELAEYIECALRDPTVTDEDRAALRDLLIQRLSSPRRDTDEIVVPTGKLFIEALPGEHPLLEDFKLHHRAIDVKKARAEVREAELNNLRRAARLLAGDYDDPEIDKRVLVQGTAGVVVQPE